MLQWTRVGATVLQLAGRERLTAWQRWPVIASSHRPMMSIKLLGSQVRGAVLAPRQGLLKGKDRLYAARAFFEALQLQKDKKVLLCTGPETRCCWPCAKLSSRRLCICPS